MPMFLVNGTYRVTGCVASGDTVLFHPDDPQAFSSLRLPARINSAGGVRLRLAGLDALETAYAPRCSATAWHQPAELAAAGAAALTTALGFDQVQREGARVLSSRPVAVPGHVLTRGVDVSGRVVGFAFPGRRRGVSDLTSMQVDAVTVRGSVNWMLLRQGLAYPVSYAELYPDLRTELAAAARHAHGQRRGVWPRDVTCSGFDITDREQLQDGLVLLPKLFRRLVDYLELEGPGSVSLSGFPAYLTARADRLVTLPDAHVTHLDAIVEVQRQKIRLTVPLEQLVFFER